MLVKKVPKKLDVAQQRLLSGGLDEGGSGGSKDRHGVNTQTHGHELSTLPDLPPAHAAVLKKIKSVFDPDGIIAPGKYNI